MIFDSFDIYAIESNIEIADYVTESARFEIDSGNDLYISAFEEAMNTSEKMNDSWISKIISKIKMFAKSAIAKLKMVLNQLATRFRKVKAVRIQKKLSSGKFDNKELKGETTNSIGSALALLQNYNSALSSKVNNCCSKFAESVRNKKVPKSKDEFIKSYLDINIDSKSSMSDAIPFNTAKNYIDNAVQYLTQLSNSTKDISSIINGLKENGIGSSEIRYGISTMYNHLASAVRDYYSAAMTVAKYFMKNSSTEQSKDNTTKSKEIIDEAEKIFKDLANEIDINESEISEIARQQKADIEKAYNNWKNIRSSSSNLKQLPENASRGINYLDDSGAVYMTLTKYALKVSFSIERRIEKATSVDELDSIRESIEKAMRQYDSLVDKVSSGKLTKRDIEDFKIGEFRKVITSSLKDKYREIDETKNRVKSTNKTFDVSETSWEPERKAISQIAHFLEEIRFYDAKTIKEVKNKGIIACDKIIQKMHKRYGSNPNNKQMNSLDETTLKDAIRLRKKLESL